MCLYVQPGAVKLVLWRHCMHESQVHPARPENQFHCTRLYVCACVRACVCVRACACACTMSSVASVTHACTHCAVKCLHRSRHLFALFVRTDRQTDARAHTHTHTHDREKGNVYLDPLMPTLLVRLKRQLKKVSGQRPRSAMLWKTLEKSGLEPAAPNRPADRNHCALSTQPSPIY